jgi:hypothetical protein
MRYTAPLALAFAASTALAVGNNNDNDDSQINIFKRANERWYARTLLRSLHILNIKRDGAICKGKVTPAAFPGLVAPSEDGGCVRCKCSTRVPS